MADGFLSRWSRKKQLDQAIEQSGQVTTLQREDREAVPGVDPVDLVDVGPHPHQGAVVQPNESPRPGEPAPDLEQAKQLPVGADVSRFMKGDVSEEARQEALQKLFSDPMYNVISEMDDYVEDYSNLPNLSRDELKKLNHIKGLFLFEDPPWKIEAEEEERRAALAAQGRQSDEASADPSELVQSESVTAQESAANTITVSPPPPHVSRPKPAQVKGKDDPYAKPDDAVVEPVQLSGRRYQPTKKQD
jgi:hypothetical protein